MARVLNMYDVERAIGVESGEGAFWVWLENYDPKLVIAGTMTAAVREANLHKGGIVHAARLSAQTGTHTVYRWQEPSEGKWAVDSGS